MTAPTSSSTPKSVDTKKRKLAPPADSDIESISSSSSGSEDGESG